MSAVNGHLRGTHMRLISRGRIETGVALFRRAPWWPGHTLSGTVFCR